MLYAIRPVDLSATSKKRPGHEHLHVARTFVAAVMTLNEVIHGAIVELKIEPWNGGECKSMYTLPYLNTLVR